MSTTKFQVPSKEIHRSEIKNAPYNPRIIDEKAKTELRKNIKDRGLMGGIVINEKTMHIVSGHQRLEQLDILEGTNDYYLRVDVANLTDKQEIEQNIFMNNAKVQGKFDDAKLKELVPSIDFKLAGLDDYDMNMLGLKNFELKNDIDLPELDILPKVKKKGQEEAPEELDQEEEFEYEDEDSDIPDNLNELGETPEEEAERKKAEIKEKKRKALEKNQNDVDEGDTYAMITFNSHAEKAEFMKRFDMKPTDRYIDGAIFSDMIERID